MRITEEEIRPEDVFNEYLKLTSLDTKTFFDNAIRLVRPKQQQRNEIQME